MSEGLEALKELRYRIANFNGKFNDYNKIMGTIEQEFKALEIIKNKRVNVFWLIECISCYHENALKRYNEDVLCKDIDCLTQEEYDLLKEVLKNE